MSAQSPKSRDRLSVFPSNNSVWPGVLISIEVGLAVFLLIAITDVLALRGTFGHQPMLLADVAASLVCSGLVFQLWRHLKARHDRLLKRFQVIAEMNHHIRNALQEIQYSAYATQNPDLVGHIRHASDRINWALQEVLPQIETDNLQPKIPNPAAKIPSQSANLDSDDGLESAAR